jgi:phytoene dehydrogenase-like protein
MSDSDSIVDLLVFGGGMAGMSAAARACSEGASVILVEKGPGVGGSAMYAGFVWTAPTVDVMREVNPQATAGAPPLIGPPRRGSSVAHPGSGPTPTPHGRSSPHSLP